MIKYNNGKVYKIEPTNGDDGDVYFGSTTKEYLSQRMATHKNKFKMWTNGQKYYIKSFELFEKYGFDNCKIILLENVNANSKDELLARESYYIRNFKCVNKVIPNRTKKEYSKEYNIKNKDKNIEYQKDYQKKNKEKISIRKKAYDEENKEKRKVKITCECGSVCRKYEIRRHEKSKKHIDFINNQNLNPI